MADRAPAVDAGQVSAATPAAARGEPVAKASYGELVVVALPAAWRWLRMASVSFRAPQILSYGIWGYGAFGAIASLLLARWWPLAVAASVTVLVGYLSVLIPLSIAKAGFGGRTLVRETTTAGSAYAVLRHRDSADLGGSYWQLSDLVSVHSLRRPLPAQRGDRPGARLLQGVQRSAEQRGFGVRLTAANRTLAQKVYLPAGYVFDSPAAAPAVRPKMHLEPHPRADG